VHTPLQNIALNPSLDHSDFLRNVITSTSSCLNCIHGLKWHLGWWLQSGAYFTHQ